MKLRFFTILFLMVLYNQFHCAVVSAQDQITEEYIVGILSGEKKDLNYVGKKVIKNQKTSLGISFKINFDYDSSEINEDSYKIIVALGKTIESKLFLKDRFRIIGHTDSRGTESYNKGLSLRRAESVKQMLTDFFSVEPEKLIVEGVGETRPIASNDTDEGRARNRRVEILREERSKNPESSLQK
ncbi:MAG: OmpA family protein [Nitrospinota bacterium]